MGEPYVAFDSYADAIAGALTDFAIKASLAAGAVLLVLVCIAALADRARREKPPR